MTDAGDIMPEGEDIRNAVKWISECRLEKKDIPLHVLLEEACVRFDLSPKKADFLRRLICGEVSEEK
ncbi:MAG: hypothetical protein RDU59_00515 [Thermodesulfobacteriota bacterium]|nr:hypothetical protein [Thermodesulfobacteriota bacterium]